MLLNKVCLNERPVSIQIVRLFQNKSALQVCLKKHLYSRINNEISARLLKAHHLGKSRGPSSVVEIEYCPSQKLHRRNGMPEQKIQSPRVFAILSKRLSELEMTRSDFIRKFHKDHDGIGAKNHLFKILNGNVIVGERGLLPLIVKSMGLDLEDMLKAVRTDKIQAKDWASAVPKANKTMQEVVTVMESLSKRDQEEILMFAKMKAGRR